METVFLWLVLCFDGSACADSQVLQIDAFVGESASGDCDKRLGAVSSNIEAAGLAPVTRKACKTLAQFEREGVES